jgi:predicted transcriptional regulator
MMIELAIAPDMRARIDAIAARYDLSPSQIIADALENGHSLDWQEMYLEKVAAGIAAADRGDFATEADIAAVRNKYRQG